MAKAKQGKLKRLSPKKVDPKVEKDLGPGHVTRPESDSDPKHGEAEVGKR